MESQRIAVVGIGATGSVLAAALLRRRPDTILVARTEGLRQTLLTDGLRVSGALSYAVPAAHVAASIAELRALSPDVVFLCTKTFHLAGVLEELADVFRPGMTVVSAHNGLGPEDLIAERFGAAAALRMSLNYGAASRGPGEAEVAFFNRPNPLGALHPDGEGAAAALAALLTEGGLDTERVEDIKRFVWKKMVMKCTMASICAVTDRTIKGALEYPPTREIAEACFGEVLAVARAMGYDLGPDYATEILAYLEKVGIHKDSMCHDIAARRPTEIDFLGGKVVEYARQQGIAAPAYAVMTNLVRALEDAYLRG